MATLKEDIAELKLKYEELTNRVDLLYKAIEELSIKKYVEKSQSKKEGSLI